MGLGASQARLLSLTSRMHDLEYKSQKLEAQKLDMANKSQQIYTDYQNALNATKFQVKSLATDGTATYIDATGANLVSAGYAFEVTGGANPGTVYNTIDKAAAAIDSSMTKVTGTAEQVTNMVDSGAVVLVKITKAMPDTENGKALSALQTDGYITDNPAHDPSGAESNIGTDTNLQEVSDDTETKKAEAKYEADLAKIDAKDKKYDTDIASIDNERTAIKTEIDTLKTVAKDNIERTFKLFG